MSSSLERQTILVPKHLFYSLFVTVQNVVYGVDHLHFIFFDTQDRNIWRDKITILLVLVPLPCSLRINLFRFDAFKLSVILFQDEV